MARRHSAAGSSRTTSAAASPTPPAAPEAKPVYHYRAIHPVTVTSGALVALDERLAKKRGRRIAALRNEPGWYVTRENIEIKAGEEFALHSQAPKGQLPSLEVL